MERHLTYVEDGVEEGKISETDGGLILEVIENGYFSGTQEEITRKVILRQPDIKGIIDCKTPEDLEKLQQFLASKFPSFRDYVLMRTSQDGANDADSGKPRRRS